MVSSKLCPEAGKSKLCFESKQAANRFIAFNSELILRQHGFAPVRSYLCPACGCWHVTSKPRTSDARSSKKSGARSGKKSDAKCVRKHSEQEAESTPLAPELRHDLQRQLRHMERCLQSAFKALSLCDMKRVKTLCNEALQCYQHSLIVPAYEAQKMKLLSRLTYCVNAWEQTRNEWMRRLCHVDYHPATVRYRQWYM